MPEGPEIETEKLHEAIKEELEHEGGSFRAVDCIVDHDPRGRRRRRGAAGRRHGQRSAGAPRPMRRACRLRLPISGASIRPRASRPQWRNQPKTRGPPPASRSRRAMRIRRARYEEEQREIKAKAEELEKEAGGIGRTRSPTNCLHRHHGFANAVALFQVAIALGALAGPHAHQARLARVARTRRVPARFSS